jgi:hypothetical protein
MNEESQLELANREFEQILPTRSGALDQRMRLAFQMVTLVPGLPQIGQRAFTAPGGMPYQTGPSPFSDAVMPGGSGPNGGEGQSIVFNLIGGPTFYGPANPGSEPPVGPEERLRFSCVSGKCLQDPNGVYYGIDECLADACGTSGGGGGPSKGCDCGCGPSLTVLKAEITGIIGPGAGYTTGTGRKYWTYTWTEITTSATVRTSTTSGLASNEYELTVDNDGDNDVPTTATVSRKRIPDGAKVDLLLDESCTPWFVLENPLAVDCNSGLIETIDGGVFDGT